MINNYLNNLQKDEENLNEFIVLPIILIISKSIKLYVQHKKIARYCVGTMGVERKKCFLKYKIAALEKVLSESSGFKETCKTYSKNIPKCIKKVDEEMERITKEIKILKSKLAKL